MKDPDAVCRFLNEAEIIAMTDHPNIVKLFGFGEWKGGLYIAMEFIQGITLRQFMMQNPLSLKRAIELTLGISHALCHLHAHGVIHRDLNPENILVTEKAEIKVIDFGVAQLKASPKNKEEKRIIGSPFYMSQEQQQSPNKVSPASDIYSLGIIAYEMILGKLCWGKIHLSLIPRGMYHILSKALQTKPEDRYQDTVDLINDLSEYLNSSNFEKEKKATDKISELAEGFQNIQQIFLPKAPDWPDLDLGVEHVKGLHLSGFYYDFIKGTSEYGIIIGHSQIKGTQGIFETSYISGLARGLLKKENQKEDLPLFLDSLNKEIFGNPLLSPFSFQYLILSPKEKTYCYISCGMGQLFHLKQNRIDPVRCKYSPLGSDPTVEFQARTNSVEFGEKLLLHSISNFEDPSFKGMAISLKQSNVQELAHILSRRLSLSLPDFKEPSVLMTLKLL